MSTVEKGIIAFRGYEVKHIEFNLNDTYDDTEVTIEMQIGAEVNVNHDTQDMTVDLELTIFKDAKENNYPFEMSLVVRGYFGINDSDKEQIEKYQSNALAILFPYARALVSTYTANANVSPLILPTININKFLDKTKADKAKVENIN